MDIHTVDDPNFSVEDVVKAHMQDLAIQDRFGVTQLKYWVNEHANTIFCLMKGPNKEACNQVHVESHGNTACNIIEVSDNEYNLFMGIGTEVNDLAKTHEGELDTGYRTLMQVNFLSLSGDQNELSAQVLKAIEEHDGVIVLDPSNELMASFIYANDAMLCANRIQGIFETIYSNVVSNISISCGRPVDEEGSTMFEETKKRIQAMASTGLTGQIMLDNEVCLLAEKEVSIEKADRNGFRILFEEDVALAIEVRELFDKHLTQPGFQSKDLEARLGLSKSQVYRKMKHLCDQAPNQLIQEARLQVAINDLALGNKNVSEVAYEAGYNSPT